MSINLFNTSSNSPNGIALEANKTAILLVMGNKILKYYNLKNISPRPLIILPVKQDSLTELANSNGLLELISQLSPKNKNNDRQIFSSAELTDLIGISKVLIDRSQVGSKAGSLIIDVLSQEAVYQLNEEEQSALDGLSQRLTEQNCPHQIGSYFFNESE